MFEMGVFFNDRNSICLSGKFPQVYGNIATTKLIQCGMAEKPENKAFHGFCGCCFLPFWSAAALHGLFCPAILHLFLTIASNR